MDYDTREALEHLARAIQNDRNELQEAFKTVGKALTDHRDSIMKLQQDNEELKKAVAELILINGGSNADQSNKS